jgi:hypothetical protein
MIGQPLSGVAKSQFRGRRYVKKLSLALALCGSLACSPVHAKTFVAVLWPMFGPLPAIGLVELVAEIKMMPDVEVNTYVHQAWPSLVEDIDNQPKGVRTIVIGYSLGANSTAFVANNAHYIDEIIALQPSLLSWNPPVDPGKVGRMIEIYNPNPWMTFGGMGSKKLIGENIEYIENDDSHVGAQFSSQFRDMVKTEVARISAEDNVQIAQAQLPVTLAPTEPQPVTADLSKHQPKDLSDLIDTLSYSEPAQAGAPRPAKPAKPPHAPEAVAAAAPPPQPKPRPKDEVAFLDSVSKAAVSRSLAAARPLTSADMMDYVKRNYQTSHVPGAAGE